MAKYCPSCMAENPDGAEVCYLCGGDMHIQNRAHQLPVMTIFERRYMVGRVLGEGGFGITYIGFDFKLREKVAIKEYYPSGISTRYSEKSLAVEATSETAKAAIDQGKTKFLEEARTMAKLRNVPNVVNVIEFFYANGTAYIVMEYLDGQSMQEWLKEHGPEKDFDRLYAMLRPVMQSLAQVHKAGLIHRDISPSNLMLLKDGTVKLLDFGTAKEADGDGQKSKSVVLKHGFAPEEQYSCHGEQGPWTDVYALCATVYKLLTGVTPQDSISRRTKDDLKRPSEFGVKISPKQERVLLKGLAVKKEDRIKSVDELMEKLDAAGKAKEPKKPKKPKEPKEPKKPKNKHCGLILAGLAAAVITLGIFCFGNAAAPDSITAISAGGHHTVALRENGTVVAVGNNEYRQCNVSDWKDIVEISAGDWHTVGLKADGTVVATEVYGEHLLNHHQGDVSDWTNIVEISAGSYHTVGLKAGGTVVATGDERDGRCNVSEWTDIVAISAGENYTIGLKSDGTVVSTKEDYRRNAMSEWTGIVAISAGSYHTVGLKTDGTVVATGDEKDGRCNVSEWTDIVAISTGGYHTVGLKSDGTVVAAGYNGAGRCDVSSWTDIVEISAGGYHTVGLKSDGTVVATGVNDDGQCGVEDWYISSGAGYEEAEPSAPAELSARSPVIAVYAGYGYTVGLREDGTVVATVQNENGQFDVSGWKDIVDISLGHGNIVGLKSDGTVVAMKDNRDDQYDVTDWTDIVAISTGLHTVGLKSDGTVVATGNNEYGQCDVADWTDIIAICVGEYHTVGLKSDGTVVATEYYSRYNQYNPTGPDVSEWKDIVAISSTYQHIVGLKSDGTVVATGLNDDLQCNVSDWENIVAISAGDSHTVGLKADGTVEATGWSTWSRCDVSQWTDIVAVCTGTCSISALRSDGTVVATDGEDRFYEYDWSDIVAISEGYNHTVGLKSDGTVVATGDNEYGQCNVEDW